MKKYNENIQIKKPKAIYARQSKDRKDSLSIDAQVEFCKRQLEPGELFELFIDRGISAKNTDRPQFQRMLSKIKNDEFSGVIVYNADCKLKLKNISDFPTFLCIAQATA
jgi:DNA invertase Pin-like site-specific DNA recombinase